MPGLVQAVLLFLKFARFCRGRGGYAMNDDTAEDEVLPAGSCLAGGGCTIATGASSSSPKRMRPAWSWSWSELEEQWRETQ